MDALASSEFIDAGDDIINIQHRFNMADIFQSTPNWSFTPEDELASTRLAEIQAQTIEKLPLDFYSGT